MSTVPGPESWRDAGLTAPAPGDLVDLDADLDADLDTDVVADLGGVEDYAPRAAASALRGDADEADLADQLTDVSVDDQDDYR